MSGQSPEAPVDRFCDLVMKGGITSGIVYPPAICKLAQEYRFKNIGGTSAGAIAAVLTAAAEYRRRKNGSLKGFELLASVPDLLKTDDESGKSRLLRLFQPDKACGRLFKILECSLNAGGTFRRIGYLVLGCLLSYWSATAISIALTFWVYWGSRSEWTTGLFLLLCLPILMGLRIYWDVTRNVVNNNYGLCRGLTTRSRYGEALTPWLHELIQKVADLPPDAPLTFRDLWDAPGFPPDSMRAPAGPSGPVRSIDLQMFTTNLSHGRPYIFPHIEPTCRLFFNTGELAPYLPDPVLRWMDAKGIDYTDQTRSVPSNPPVSDAVAKGLKEIPGPGDLPVLLATRMSLSFPILFSAVPLWAIDYEDPKGHRKFRRCLFSDGGISSNFPVHLFDGLLPQWPTFGISLEPALPSLPDSLIFLPHAYNEGIADRWLRFDQAKRSASRLGGFVSSIMSTMQNWNDNTLSRMPGVRDRVVRLRLKPDEGGLNLNMPPKIIDAIAERGSEAGQVLIKRFLAPSDSPAVPGDLGDASDPIPPSSLERRHYWTGWNNQRWVRLDVLMRTLADKSAGLGRSLGEHVPHALSYEDLLNHARREAPPGHNAPLTDDQAKALNALIQAMDAVSQTFDANARQYENAQTPNPDLRVRPSL